MPEYIYVLRPARLEMLTDGGTAEENRIVGEHFAHLQRLTAEKTAVLVGRTQTSGPETFGIVVFNAQDEAEARCIMQSDPAVQQGVMTANLFPFHIALRS
jgi:hypothetical protein